MVRKNEKTDSIQRVLCFVREHVLARVCVRGDGGGGVGEASRGSRYAGTSAHPAHNHSRSYCLFLF